MIDDRLKYEDFEDFCKRAKELRDLYAINDRTPSFLMKQYQDYIFSHYYGKRYTNMINSICWAWILSTTYEEVPINDLYCVLGKYRRSKGNGK